MISPTKLRRGDLCKVIDSNTITFEYVIVISQISDYIYLIYCHDGFLRRGMLGYNLYKIQ